MTAPRVGFGYDIHRLAPDRRLVLGGIPIEHPTGLVGHSDGDVLLHAIVDALLGAAGLGDIGTHFPDDDPAHAGADSVSFVERAVRLLAESGQRVASVDATVIAEAPRLAAHTEAMRTRIARALGVAPSAVNVKAKTNEGLGVIGAREAIAAMAVAVLEAR
ncbi:MAG TPA: 2-C-methyl-D-erythritol 2,4-cyclodiphosphate synthase [Candidatus Limnocylindria bacterium]|nr:2-C-methyl-D-erythritol 2,4-cyclodiphosphate synthase [Candidatus Limnocylindria bacterium]